MAYCEKCGKGFDRSHDEDGPGECPRCERAQKFKDELDELELNDEQLERIEKFRKELMHQAGLYKVCGRDHEARFMAMAGLLIERLMKEIHRLRDSKK